MSLPLHDCGSVKLPEDVHSFVKAKAVQRRVDVTTLIREYVVSAVMEEFHTFTLASEIHEAKGFGKIDGDRDR